MNDSEPVHIAYYLEDKDEGSLWSYWTMCPLVPRVGETVYYWPDIGYIKEWDANVLADAKNARGEYIVVTVHYECREMFYARISTKQTVSIIVRQVKQATQ